MIGNVVITNTTITTIPNNGTIVDSMAHLSPMIVSGQIGWTNKDNCGSTIP